MLVPAWSAAGVQACICIYLDVRLELVVMAAAQMADHQPYRVGPPTIHTYASMYMSTYSS